MLRALTALILLFCGSPLHAADDPTRPMTEAEIRAWLNGGPDGAASADLELQSILLSDTRRIAIINGRRVAVGDRIANARILSIEAGAVRLERDDATVTLELQSSYRSDN